MAHAGQTWHRWLRLLVTGVLSLILLALLYGPASGQNNPRQPVEIKVTARRFEFDPRTITVQKDQPVRLVITSADVDHGFAIKEFNLSVKIAAKKTKIVEFTPDRAGRFRFYCTVYCGDGHEDMLGELVVEEAQTAGTGIKVTFDDHVPGVAIIESNGERLRIDTSAKTVTRIGEKSPQQTPPAKVAKVEQTKAPEGEPYDYRLVNVPNGVTDKLYVSAYRSPLCQRGLCRTIELGVGYHWLDEKGHSPVALSTYASIEGDENFSQHYTYNLQTMLARSVTKYVNLFFSPAVHFNANGQRRFDPRATDFFPPAPVADTFRQDKHAASFGFGVNARIKPTVSLLFEYTPRVGFKLGRVRPIFNSNFTRIVGFSNESEAEIGFGIQKDIGRHTFSLTFSNTQTTTTARYNSSNLVLPPKKFIIGFNLYRRFLK